MVKVFTQSFLPDAASGALVFGGFGGADLCGPPTRATPVDSSYHDNGAGGSVRCANTTRSCCRSARSPKSA